MSSERAVRRNAVRRWLPWAMWAVAAVAAVPLFRTASGVGVAPAVIETRRVALSSPRTLPVETLLVAPGEAVKAGQVLARMEAVTVDSELAAAEAELQKAELTLASRAAELEGDRSKTAGRMASDAERASMELARLVTENERDRGTLAQLEEQLVREERLVSGELARAERLNELKLERAALATKVERAADEIKQAREVVAAASRRVDEWKPGAGAAPATSRLQDQIAPERAAVEVKRHLVEGLKNVRARLELKAPFDGRVGAVYLRAGETAIHDLPIVAVVDDRPTTAIAYVEQAWANKIQVGDRAELRPKDGMGPRRTGQVVALGVAVVDLPERFWRIPKMVDYGREVYVRLDEAAAVPGQAYEAAFRHAAEGRP